MVAILLPGAEYTFQILETIFLKKPFFRCMIQCMYAAEEKMILQKNSLLSQERCDQSFSEISMTMFASKTKSGSH